MKKFKKLITLVITLAMVLAMNVTVFAATPEWTISDATTNGKSQITVTNLKSGGNQEVTLFKVYTLDADNSCWKLNSAYKESGLAETVTTTTPTIDGDSLMTYFNGKTGDAAYTTAAAETSHAFTGLEPGFYFVRVIDKDGVVTYNPMYVNTYDYDGTSYLFTAKDATCEAKYGNVPVKKTQAETNNDQVVYVGQTIAYTINGVIKAGETSYTITDTLTGADYNDDWKLTIGGADVSVTDNMLTKTDNGFTLTITNDNKQYDGCQVVLTYTATVNQSAINGVANTVKDSNDSTGSTTKDYTATVKVTKNDANGNALSGAQFALKNADGKYADLTTKDGKVYFTGTWLDTEPAVNSDDVVTTGVDGTATIYGLDLGTYTFVEVKAPNGYTINKDGGTSTVALAEGKTKAEAQDDISVTNSTVTDTKLSELPSTGGRGTLIFTLIGCAVMVVFAASYIRSKKNAR